MKKQTQFKANSNPISQYIKVIRPMAKRLPRLDWTGEEACVVGGDYLSDVTGTPSYAPGGVRSWLRPSKLRLAQKQKNSLLLASELIANSIRSTRLSTTCWIT
jgi:hypothetical protein